MKKALMTIAILTGGLIVCSSSGTSAPSPGGPGGGKTYRIHTFDVHDLFARSAELQLNPVETGRLKQEIQATLDEGLTPIAVSTTWVFPEGVSAPKVPRKPVPLLSGAVKESHLNCIPITDEQAYNALAQTRNKMYSVLARDFPEIRVWLVGYEPNFFFLDCEGRPLEGPPVIRFIADTLKGISKATKTENKEARVMAHFLGQQPFPIAFGETVYQPRELLSLLRAEIAERGGRESEFFDDLVTSLDPELAADRAPESPVVGTDTATTSTGWNTKWKEEFTTDTTDLVADTRYHWDDWDTWSTIIPTSVSGEKAALTLNDPNGCIGGARTDPDQDVVPDSEFPSQHPYTERNKWTAVMDFYPTQCLTDPTAHTPVFMRVTDQNWYVPGVGWVDDQTRFGTFIYGDIDPNLCQNNPCGALQFTGRSSVDPDTFDYELVEFSLTQLPWDDDTTLCRVQIIEREYWHVLQGRYQLQWMAEVWMGGNRIGYTAWIWEWSVVNVFGVSIPELAGSKHAIGLGPGYSGRIDVERSGTAYWIY